MTSRLSDPLFDMKLWDLSKSDLIDSLSKNSFDRVSKILCTPNLSFFYKMRQSEELRSIICSFDYIIADSRFIQLVNWVAGRPSILVLPGSDLVPEVFKVANEKQHRIGIIGGSIDADFAKLFIKREYPNLELSYFNSDEIDINDVSMMDEMSRDIKKIEPQIIFVGLGFPKQEHLSAILKSRGCTTIFMNVGMGIDYFFGVRARAPKIMRFFMLEWLYRFASEPKRLARRYFLECVPELLRAIWASVNWRRNKCGQ